MSVTFQSQFLSKQKKEKEIQPNMAGNPENKIASLNNLNNLSNLSNLQNSNVNEDAKLLNSQFKIKNNSLNNGNFNMDDISEKKNIVNINTSINDSKIGLLKPSLKNSHFDMLNEKKASQNLEVLTNLNKLNSNNNKNGESKSNYKNTKQISSGSSSSSSFDSKKSDGSSFGRAKKNELTPKTLKKKNLSIIEGKKSYAEDTPKSNQNYNKNEEKKFHGGLYSQSDKDRDKGDQRRLIKIEKICDSDTEDEGSDNEKEVTCIILPDNGYKRIFDIIVALVILYSSIVLPYKIAFIDNDLDSDDIVENIFNSILILDVVLNFFSAYVDNEDNVVKNRKKIIKSYLKTWFLVDLISVLPINYFSEYKNSNRYNALARLSRIPKIYRLIRLTKLFRMVKILKKGNVNKVTKFFLEKLKVNANIERLIYFILAFLLLNHLAACIWYFVAKLQDLNPDCWVTRLGYIDASNTEIYIVSFYWTLTTVTTVGYGDVNAGTTIERIYNLFIMSFGVLMYSFAIGSLSSIVSTLDAKTAEMNQKLQILSSIKKEFSLDQEIYDKVRKVIKYDLSRNQKDKMNFLQELPNKLRIELSQIMHDSVIQKMYFFKDQPSDFIAYVAPLLKPVKFSQNDFLYKISDMIDEMYFVSKGTVSFCLGKEYLDKEIKEIKKHNNFGEIEMCLNEKLSFNIKVKSRNCELFVLKKNDFLRLSVNFKEFIEKFLQRSLMIYLRFNDEKKNVMKQMEDQNKLINATMKNNMKGKQEILEMIDEKEEEDGSEYNIFGDHTSDSEDQSGTVQNSVSNESSHSEPSKDNNIQKNEQFSSLNIHNSIENNKENMQHTYKMSASKSSNNQAEYLSPNNGNKKTNLTPENNNENIINLINNGSTEKRMNTGSNNNRSSVENMYINNQNNLNNTINQSSRRNTNNNLINPMNNLSNDLDFENKKEQNGEAIAEGEKTKTNMNKKFVKKVDKIIEFLERNKFEEENPKDNASNPLILLKQLKNIQDLSERNEIIDKIEGIITDIFNKQEK